MAKSTSMKKNHSHATPLRATEVKVPRNTKKKDNEKSLGQVAQEAHNSMANFWKPWAEQPKSAQEAWEVVANAVLEAVIERVKRKIGME